MNTQTGGLTFVFTDIESSTQLLGDLQVSYGLALRLHRRIIQTCFEEQDGRQLGSEGDGLFFVFPNAVKAVAAAIAAQERFEHYAAAEEFGLRVRMGIHTGPVRLSGGEYLGLTIHEVARICAAAHGGQILCSDDVRRLAKEVEGVTFRELGSFALRGIATPKILCQVGTADVELHFPPPRDVVRDGGARVTIWRRGDAGTVPAGGPKLDFTGVDGGPLGEDLTVEVLPGSGTRPGPFRVVVRRGGTIEEEYDGLMAGGPADAAGIVNAHSALVRIRPAASDCPVCGVLGATWRSLADHLVGEAEASDARHVMWLNRNVTKHRLAAAELAPLLESALAGRATSAPKVRR